MKQFWNPGILSHRRLCSLLLVMLIAAAGQDSRAAREWPVLGAEVFVEPGNTRQQIDGWMKTLAQHHMPLARVFILWDVVQPSKGHWSFDLYDDVFASAKENGVGILATLVPRYPARTAAMLKENEDYIVRVVERYKTNSALDTWLLVNEPGSGPQPDDMAVAGFRLWLEKKYGNIEALNHAWSPRGGTHHSFADLKPETTGKGWDCGNWADWRTYARAYQARQLDNIAQAVLIHDKAHGIHVNPAGLLGNLARMSDDLPQWRPFVTAMGASLHPAWHFGLLQSRDQFPLGVSYICDLVRGASEPKPFWVTELQAGNNIYSGTRPLYPDGNDISQWLWVSLGSGAERVVFWLLNTRESGTEAGEWSLLDLQGRPSERLLAAAGVAKILEQNRDLFAGAKPMESPVTIMLSLETMTLQMRYGDANEHILEALGLYEALHDLGVPVQLKHMGDYPWRSAGSNQTVILPHVSALSKQQGEDIAAFVIAGNRILVTGLTGFFDPLSHVWPAQAHPPLEEVLGGVLKEVRYLNPASVNLEHPDIRLPATHLVGDIDNKSAVNLGADGERILATSKTTGAGQAIWIPSLIGNGAWFGDRAPMREFLKSALKDAIAAIPFRFADGCPGLELRTLRNGSNYMTIIANGGAGAIPCRLAVPTGYAPRFLVGSRRELVKSESPIQGHETLVIVWTHP